MGISLGLVGLGAFGSEFAPLFMSHPLVDRIALCDREPERVARFARDPASGPSFGPPTPTRPWTTSAGQSSTPSSS